MDPSLGYQVPSGHVCKLNRSLYGLKQASRQWNGKITHTLLSIGFHQSWHDYSLFVRSQKEILIMLLVYVDDILVFSNDQGVIAEVKGVLYNLFKTKDLGEAIYIPRDGNNKR